MTKGWLGIVALLATVACGEERDGAGAAATAKPPGEPAATATPPSEPAVPAKAPSEPAARPPAAAADPPIAAGADGLGDPRRLGASCLGYTPDGTVAVVLAANRARTADNDVRLQAFTAGGKPPFAPIEILESSFEVDESLSWVDARNARVKLVAEAWAEQSVEERAWIAGAKLMPCASKRFPNGDDEDYDEATAEEQLASGWEITVGGTPVKVNDVKKKLTVAVGGRKPRTVAALIQEEMGENSWESIHAIDRHDKSPLLVVVVVNNVMGNSEYTVHTTTIR